jgi:hypothetical protein
MLVVAAVAGVGLAGTAPVSAFAAGANDIVPPVEVACPLFMPPGPSASMEPRSVVESQVTFLVADSRLVVNSLDTPATASFTSTVSRTFGVSGSVGVGLPKLLPFLTINVSASITSSTTTAIGVTASAPVPPHSSVIAEYGALAYAVTYDTYLVLRRADQICYLPNNPVGSTFTVTAPTTLHGWRVRPGPTVD